MWKELLEAYRYCRAHKGWTVMILTVTVCAAILGAYAGTLAYYHGWLG